MGIKGLTDRPASFPRIGILRKGAESVEKTNSSGKKYNSYGRDLDHFRFDTEDADALAAFEVAYGPEPRQINVYLPYTTADENFGAWKECWTASSLQHRCDGETCVLWLDRATNKYRSDPVPCPGGCKEVGRLMVIVPELRRMAYVIAETHSKNDILEISSNLAAIEQAQGTLRGIPMRLSRKAREISTPMGDGKRTRTTKWLLHIEVAPRWVDLMLQSAEQRALPAPAQGTSLALPAPAVDYDTGEIIDQPAQPAPAPKRPASRTTLERRIKELQAEADDLGIDPAKTATPKPLADMTEPELIEFGKVLATAVKAASEDQDATAD